MHHELEITLNNEFFTVKVNPNIIEYLRRFKTTTENWYDITLKKEDITNLKKLTVREEEKEFINKLIENVPVDILEHFYF